MTSENDDQKSNGEAVETTKKKKFRGEVYIDIERCKGCGFCVEFCPTHTLAQSHEINSKGYHPPKIADIDACTGCGLCGMYCPDFAIFGIRIKLTDTEEKDQQVPMDLLPKNEE